MQNLGSLAGHFRLALVFAAAVCSATIAAATGLPLTLAPTQCGIELPSEPRPPAAATGRLPDGQAVQGRRDIAWAWLGTPTSGYAHAALGSNLHAGSLHVLVPDAMGRLHELTYQLPLERVFEDRVARMVDLDKDGRDEIVLVEADAREGASLVVFGLRTLSGSANLATPKPAMTLVELARSPSIGQPMRWLNPIDSADFDGDGRIDLASVVTPHLGGILTLYQFQPPHLVPFASTAGFSNHRNGTLEQQLAVVINQAGKRPAILISDLQYRILNLLRWEAPGRWSKIASSDTLPAAVAFIKPIPGGACLRLTNGSWWNATLGP